MLSAGIITDSIPEQAIHYYPMDEGSGSTLADAVGSADFTTNGGVTWVSDSRYTGGVAPSFDGTDDYAQGSPDLSTPFTAIIRTYTTGLGSSSPTYRSVLVHADDSSNLLVYTVGGDEWRGDQPRTQVADADATGEHILALTSGNNQTELRVYNGDESLHGSDSASGEMSYTGAVNLARWDDNSRYWDGEFDTLTIADSVLSQTEIEDIIAKYY
jgi:hypothetical protein